MKKTKKLKWPAYKGLGSFHTAFYPTLLGIRRVKGALTNFLTAPFYFES